MQRIPLFEDQNGRPFPAGGEVTGRRRFLLLRLVVLGLALLIGCEEESLRIQPGDVTLSANQSVA